MSELTRAVFDCNTFLQALSSPHGPAGHCVQLAIDGKVRLFISPAILDEFHDVSNRPRVIAKLHLQPERMAAFTEAIQLAATIVSGVSEPFEYARDPDEAKYVNLALAVQATLIVTRDNDLLDLMDAARREGRDFQTRFPSIRIVNPVQFLSETRVRQ